ncbi:MAG TPA: hypothetical protein VD927_00930 [Chryseosolibacter sp.]|nr:hypothetical protein [Chryseosolibacter sp.]
MVKKVSIAYLLFILTTTVIGQVLEFSEVRKLSSAVNSKGEESVPLVSSDQSKMFFVRSFYEGNFGGKYGGQDIWYAERTGNSWKPAVNRLATLNDHDNNVLIGLNNDASILYVFKSSSTEKLSGIYFSRFVNERWREAEFIPLRGIENTDFVGMYVTPEFDVMLISMRTTDSQGEEDLYISTKSKPGVWSIPKNLGPTINTSGYEISPFLSADKKRLFFASNGHNGLGDADIFYSERLYNSWETWSAPVNLGPEVNSAKFDAYFSIYGDSVAYFCSNRDQQLADIYTVAVRVGTGLLASNQEYISQDDWNSIVGKNVGQTIAFDKESTSLERGQQELLYYIGKKLSDRKDIGIHLVVKEQEANDFTDTRLKELYGHLRQAGVEASRIKEEQNPQFIKTSDQGVIQIMLFREKLNP